MSPSILAFEAQLEIESLQFLSAVNDPNKASEAQRLANILTGKMFVNSEQILKMEASGNYGLALFGVVMNKLTTSNNTIPLAVMMSYWALCNEIERNSVPLLIHNRAIIMYSNLNLFYGIHKKSVTENYSPYSIDYSIGLSAAENTIHKVIVHDLYSVREDFTSAKSLYTQLAKIFEISSSNFNMPTYYTNIHSDLKKIIGTSFEQ